MPDEPLERFILVVEHHPDQAQFIEQVLAAPAGQYRLQVVDSGVIALSFLLQQGNYANAPRPDLILLDLGVPGNENLAVLTTLKAHPHLRRIPIIVLADSGCKEEVFQSYFSQGNCYVVKATDTQQLVATLKQIENFWLEIVTLPLQ